MANGLKKLEMDYYYVFQVQKNVVLINHENQNQSHIFSYSDREKTFNY